MNNPFDNLDNEKAVSEKMHSEIMKAVKVAKRKYYLIGMLCGFLLGAIFLGYLFFVELLENQGVDFLSAFFDSLAIDFTLLADYYDDLLDFIPWYRLCLTIVAVVLFIFISIKIWQYRRILFSKVEKFSKNKNLR